MTGIKNWGWALLLVMGGLTGGCDVEYQMSGEQNGVDAPDDVNGSGTTGGENIPDNVETGDVQGRICAPDGETWVMGATVYVDTEWGRLETTTDQDGYFKLEGVPVGTQTVEVEKGSFTTTIEVIIAANEVLALAANECVGDVDIAVVTGQYDNIESILNRLNIPFDEIAGSFAPSSDGSLSTDHIALMRDPARMASYDIIFFNCGMEDSWSMDANIIQNIRDYVTNGGSIYASDQAYFVLEGPFPEAADFIGNDAEPWNANVGSMGHVQGEIMNGALKSALGKDSADINYDLDSWASVEAAGEAETLISGTFEFMDMNSGDYTYSTQTITGPLAVRHTAGEGVVLYTTFHNEPQLTEDMDNLLKEFVLSL
jgi:hypothetical protein